MKMADGYPSGYKTLFGKGEIASYDAESIPAYPFVPSTLIHDERISRQLITNRVLNNQRTVW